MKIPSKILTLFQRRPEDSGKNSLAAKFLARVARDFESIPRDDLKKKNAVYFKLLDDFPHVIETNEINGRKGKQLKFADGSKVVMFNDRPGKFFTAEESVN